MENLRYFGMTTKTESHWWRN